MSDIDETLKQRGNVHGDFTDNARVTEELMKALKSGPMWQGMDPVKKVGLFHIIHKAARIVSGDPNFADHWHDIGGYAKCVEERLDKETDPK
jgi:tRNA nucleotidyltransferase/poly(A) polymerase